MFRRELDPSGNPISVTAWRIDRLRDAGFQARLAEALARDTRCDLHALLDLVDRGYLPELAARSQAAVERARSAVTTSNGGPANWVADACATRVDRALIRSSRTSVTAARGEQETRGCIERLSASGAERDVALVEPMARARGRLGSEHALVVHGDGLDEFAPRVAFFFGAGLRCTD